MRHLFDIVPILAGGVEEDPIDIGVYEHLSAGQYRATAVAKEIMLDRPEVEKVAVYHDVALPLGRQLLIILHRGILR